MLDRVDGAAWVTITSTPSARDAGEIVYALQLRAIEARTCRLPSGVLRGKGVGVEVPTHDEARAREALPFIWDGMLGERAVTAAGECPFCGYDLTQVPADRPCPECGQDLNSVESRLRARKRGHGNA